MPKTSEKTLTDNLRAKYVEIVKNLLDGMGEEVLLTASNTLALPTVDEEQNDRFIQIVVKVPTGSREDKEPYDGYAEAESYKLKLEEKAEKAKVAAAKKAKKIAEDKAKREAKAKAKAEKEGN